MWCRRQPRWLSSPAPRSGQHDEDREQSHAQAEPPHQRDECAELFRRAIEKEHPNTDDAKDGRGRNADEIAPRACLQSAPWWRRLDCHVILPLASHRQPIVDRPAATEIFPRDATLRARQDLERAAASLRLTFSPIQETVGGGWASFMTRS
jgi:hypothetical protein